QQVDPKMSQKCEDRKKNGAQVRAEKGEDPLVFGGSTCCGGIVVVAAGPTRVRTMKVYWAVPKGSGARGENRRFRLASQRRAGGRGPWVWPGNHNAGPRADAANKEARQAPGFVGERIAKFSVSVGIHVTMSGAGRCFNSLPAESGLGNLW